MGWNHALFSTWTVSKLFADSSCAKKIECWICWAFLGLHSLRKGKLAFWLASCINSSYAYDPLSQPDNILVSVWGNISGLSQNLRHLADVCEILWISLTKLYQASELLAFISPMRSVHCFPFIHHMTFSFPWSYHRSIVAQNFRVMLFRWRSKTVCM